MIRKLFKPRVAEVVITEKSENDVKQVFKLKEIKKRLDAKLLLRI